MSNEAFTPDVTGFVRTGQTTLQSGDLSQHVTRLANGSWAILDQDDSSDGAVVRIYAADLSTVAAEVRLNAGPSDSVNQMSVMSLEDGRVAVLWSEYNGGTFSDAHLVAQVFSQNGTPLTEQQDFAARDPNESLAFYADGVAELPSGNLLATWGEGQVLMAQVLGDEQAEAFPLIEAEWPLSDAIALTVSDREVAILYVEKKPTGESLWITFAEPGQAATLPAIDLTGTLAYIEKFEAVSLADGRLAVVVSGIGPSETGNPSKTQLLMLSPEGEVLSSDFVTSSGEAVGHAEVVAMPDGTIVVAGLNTADATIRVVRYTATGELIGEASAISPTGAPYPYGVRPSLSVDESGEVSVGWYGTNGDRPAGGPILGFHLRTFESKFYGSAGSDNIAGFSSIGFSGEAGDDRIEANDFNNLVWGGSGNDTLVLLGGDDEAWGDEGRDTIVAGSGNDTLHGQDGLDRLEGGSGDDLLVVQVAGDTVVEVAGGGRDQVDAATSYVLGAQVENLVLTGSAGLRGTGNELANRITGNVGSNSLVGGGGNDTLLGGAGNDTLDGGTGTDRLEGGAGDDTYVLTAAGDTVVEAAGGGTDQVRAAVTVTLAANVENLVLTGSGSANGMGNARANQITGNVAGNALDGGAGDDVISGGRGADVLTGGRGADVLIGGTGADDFVFTAARESGLGVLRDVIKDFARGQDDLALSAIDANTTLSGNQAFHLDAGGAFSAGEIRQTQKGDNLLIELNTDGDATAEASILLSNVSGPLGANDFLL